jgi:hypothetical protein
LFLAGSLLGTELAGWKNPATINPGPVSPRLKRLQSGGLLYIPKTYRPAEPLPLLILLHAAQGTSESWFFSGHK